MRTRELVAELNKSYPMSKLFSVKLIKDFCSEKERIGKGKWLGLKEAKDIVDENWGKNRGKFVVNRLIELGHITNHKLLK
jgi:hypothetical protein